MTAKGTATRGVAHLDDRTVAHRVTGRPTAVPFRFFDVRVVRTERLGPSMTRITFGGDELAGFTGGGRDQRFKLFLPRPHQDTPVMPVRSADAWYAHWRSMDPLERPVMRSYTVREQRPHAGEFDVDFALRGDHGPASRWAARAARGDRALVLGPTAPDNGGIDFRPPDGTDWVLLAADLAALPAVAGILAWLPEGSVARAWIEVPHASDVRRLPSRADAEITWLIGRRAPDVGTASEPTGMTPPPGMTPSHRRGTTPGPAAASGPAVASGPLLRAVTAANLPPGVPYAWIAGEAEQVRDLRRHLIRDRGLDRRTVRSTGYWRRGATEEELLTEAVS